VPPAKPEDTLVRLQTLLALWRPLCSSTQPGALPVKANHSQPITSKLLQSIPCAMVAHGGIGVL
jgi:hypothetical protein